METTTAIVLGVVGALCSEAIKQKAKMSTFSNQQFINQFKRIGFWLIVIFLIGSSGLISFVMFKDSQGNLSYVNCLAIGAGAEAFLRQIGTAIASNDNISLGGERMTVSNNADSSSESEHVLMESARPTIRQILL